MQPALRSCCLIDVIRPTPPRGALLSLALAFGLVGCGGAGPQTRTFVGPVTVVYASEVCIGGPDAGGECFIRDQVTSDLRVSDCVRVTYTLNDSPGQSTASKIEHLDAATDAAACPRQ